MYRRIMRYVSFMTESLCFVFLPGRYIVRIRGCATGIVFACSSGQRDGQTCKGCFFNDSRGVSGFYSLSVNLQGEQQAY